jgi:hypothetical protein
MRRVWFTPRFMRISHYIGLPLTLRRPRRSSKSVASCLISTMKLFLRLLSMEMDLETGISERNQELSLVGSEPS